MRFELKTLVDITETGARRGEDQQQYHQQQNYLTLFHTISLRANAIVKRSPVCEKINIDHMGFGKKYHGLHTVWSLTFEYESEDSHSTELLNRDCNLVPVITQLNETATFDPAAFMTADPDLINIFFQNIDK
jgi:hypothetical protein